MYTSIPLEDQGKVVRSLRGTAHDVDHLLQQHKCRESKSWFPVLLSSESEQPALGVDSWLAIGFRVPEGLYARKPRNRNVDKRGLGQRAKGFVRLMGCVGMCGTDAQGDNLEARGKWERQGGVGYAECHCVFVSWLGTFQKQLGTNFVLWSVEECLWLVWARLGAWLKVIFYVWCAVSCFFAYLPAGCGCYVSFCAIVDLFTWRGSTVNYLCFNTILYSILSFGAKTRACLFRVFDVCAACCTLCYTAMVPAAGGREMGKLSWIGILWIDVRRWQRRWERV